MIKFIKNTLAENKDLFEKYVNSISIPYDDFLENFILESQFYTITEAGQKIGYFALNEKLLTQFYLIREYRHRKDIFDMLFEKYHIKKAFVPSTDSLFLSLATHRAREVSLQAYHFWDSGRKVEEGRYHGLKLATMEDLERIKNLCGDFFEDYEMEISSEHLYILEEGDNLLGIGVFIENKIMRECAGTGMFTNPDFRNQGVGRSIILELKKKAYDMGLTPVPGCWSGNTLSKKTLESAGYISISNLVLAEF